MVPVAAALCVPIAVARAAGGGAHRPGGHFLPWAVTVGVVALAEEAFLRGVLFDAVHDWLGTTAAVAAGATLFAALHVPLYGWHAAPLDLAVGVALGLLRSATGTWLAPGVAHTLADYTAWWLR